MRAISSAWARSASLATLLAVSAAGQQFFDERVEPILSRRCLGCHNDELKDGGVSFMGRDGLIKGGAHGPAIRPGKPDGSLLIQAVRQEGELKMPPGAKLSAGSIGLYGRAIRSLRAFTNETVNKEPKWRHPRAELTTGYQSRTF